MTSMEEEKVKYQLEKYKPIIEGSLFIFFTIILIGSILSLIIESLSTFDFVAAILLIILSAFFMYYSWSRRRDVELSIYYNRIVIFKKKEEIKIYFSRIISIENKGSIILIKHLDYDNKEKWELIQFGIREKDQKYEVYHLLKER